MKEPCTDYSERFTPPSIDLFITILADVTLSLITVNLRSPSPPPAIWIWSLQWCWVSHLLITVNGCCNVSNRFLLITVNVCCPCVSVWWGWNAYQHTDYSECFSAISGLLTQNTLTCESQIQWLWRWDLLITVNAVVVVNPSGWTCLWMHSRADR